MNDAKHPRRFVCLIKYFVQQHTKFSLNMNVPIKIKLLLRKKIHKQIHIKPESRVSKMFQFLGKPQANVADRQPRPIGIEIYYSNGETD